MSAVERELHKRLSELSPDEKRQALEYLRSLGTDWKRTATGAELLKFAGSIPKDDLRRIRQAIEEGCERIDADSFALCPTATCGLPPLRGNTSSRS